MTSCHFGLCVTDSSVFCFFSWQVTFNTRVFCRVPCGHSSRFQHFIWLKVWRQLERAKQIKHLIPSSLSQCQQQQQTKWILHVVIHLIYADKPDERRHLPAAWFPFWFIEFVSWVVEKSFCLNKLYSTIRVSARSFFSSSHLSVCAFLSIFTDFKQNTQMGKKSEKTTKSQRGKGRACQVCGWRWRRQSAWLVQ